MALQLAAATRNAELSAIVTEVGATATMEIRSGAPPAGLGDADSGTLIATLTLPASPFGTPTNGSMAKNGTWSGSASAGATAGHFRIKAAGTTPKIQGTCGQGTGDLSFDNNVIASGQTVTINTFTLSVGNA